MHQSMGVKMKLTTQKVGTRVTVKAEGRIDTNTAVEYGTTINDCLDNSNEEIKELILDFENIDYISSIGLRVILELQKRMNNQGSMKLINVMPSVMDVFKMTGFTNILTIE